MFVKYMHPKPPHSFSVVVPFSLCVLCFQVPCLTIFTIKKKTHQKNDLFANIFNVGKGGEIQ